MFPAFRPNPNPMDNPVLSEIDNAHSSLSPQAQQALDQAHKTLMAPMAMPSAGVQTIAPPSQPAANPTAAAPMRPMAAPGPATPTIAPPSAQQQELTRLTTPSPGGDLAHTKADTGQSGIGQIHNPWARIPLQILDAIGGSAAPGIEQRLPGTQGHHDLLVRHAEKNVTGEQTIQNDEAKRKLEGAQTANQASLPELHQSEIDRKSEHDKNQAEFNQHKLEDTSQQKQSALEVSMGKAGYKPDGAGGWAPLEYNEMSPAAKDMHDLTASRKGLADATAELKKAQATNSPVLIQNAQHRLEMQAESHELLKKRLGLSEREFEARTHGTDQGEALPGAMVDNSGKTVGTAFQANVRPTTSQRDAAGRAHTMEDVEGRIRQALKNPEIQKGTGPLAGRLSEAQGRLGTLPKDLAELQQDLVSYGAFQAGLHPVRGIGAMQYFEKVMGGLGQDPEQLIGKLDSNAKTAKSVEKTGDMRTAGSPAAGGGPASAPTVSSKRDFDKLPSGAVYMEDGKKYRKP